VIHHHGFFSSFQHALRFSILAAWAFLMLCPRPSFAASGRDKLSGPICGSIGDFDPALDVRALDEYQDAVAALLQQKKFDDLDCLADSARVTKARFSGGAWQLHNLYLGLSEPRPGHPTEIDWKHHFRLLEDWTSARPRSVTAQIALAESYVAYGWDARGNGFAGDVSQSGWKLMDQRVEKARKILERVARQPVNDPEWYMAMEQVAQGQSWDIAKCRQLVEEDAALEPGYYYVYRLQAHILLPRWKGQEGDAAHFAEDLASRLGGETGETAYFQIADTVLTIAVDYAEFSHFSWHRLQSDFALLEKDQGISLNNLNAYALMASRAGDFVAAEEAFKRIGENWDKDVWRTETYFQSSKTRAASLARLTQQKNGMEGEARSNAENPQGAAYKREVEARLSPMEKDCAERLTPLPPRFELLILVSTRGDVFSAQSNPLSNPTNPMAQCLFESLFKPHRTTDALLPPPPHPKYWLEVDIDPAGIASAK